jgi:hypothetical protein
MSGYGRLMALLAFMVLDLALLYTSRDLKLPDNGTAFWGSYFRAKAWKLCFGLPWFLYRGTQGEPRGTYIQLIAHLISQYL